MLPRTPPAGKNSSEFAPSVPECCAELVFKQNLCRALSVFSAHTLGLLVHTNTTVQTGRLARVLFCIVFEECVRCDRRSVQTKREERKPCENLNKSFPFGNDEFSVLGCQCQF